MSRSPQAIKMGWRRSSNLVLASNGIPHVNHLIMQTKYTMGSSITTRNKDTACLRNLTSSPTSVVGMLTTSRDGANWTMEREL